MLEYENCVPIINNFNEVIVIPVEQKTCTGLKIHDIYFKRSLVIIFLREWYNIYTSTTKKSHHEFDGLYCIMLNSSTTRVSDERDVLSCKKRLSNAEHTLHLVTFSYTITRASDVAPSLRAANPFQLIGISVELFLYLSGMAFTFFASFSLRKIVKVFKFFKLLVFYSVAKSPMCRTKRSGKFDFLKLLSRKHNIFVNKKLLKI